MWEEGLRWRWWKKLLLLSVEGWHMNGVGDERGGGVDRR